MRFSSVGSKFAKFLMSFFKEQVSVTCSSVLWHITFLPFFGSNIIYFWQKKHIKFQIFRLATARFKIHQIPHVIFSWHWRVMQNLERNWLTVSKLIWGVWLILIRSTRKSQEICTLMGSFWPKCIMFELKNYRRVKFDSTEDWYKIWRKTDLNFQKWHEEFGKFSQAEK